MVRKKNSKRVAVGNPTRLYAVYHSGLLIGTLLLTPNQIQRFEKAGYVLRLAKNPVSSEKAETILRHGTVKGHKLTPKQQRFFGARASGARMRKANVSRKRNALGLTLIYKSITRIEGQKGKNSNFPGQKFFHNFKRPFPSMYGTPDRKVLIIK